MNGIGKRGLAVTGRCVLIIVTQMQLSDLNLRFAPVAALNTATGNSHHEISRNSSTLSHYSSTNSPMSSSAWSTFGSADYSSASQSAMPAFAASGGARMQESLFSLMQMAKTSAALGWQHAAR